MERDRSITINKDFRTTLFHWQSFPENGVAIDRINSLLSMTNQMGLDLALRIKAETFENSEGRRAIQLNDLSRLAKKQGYLYTFRFRTNTETGKYSILARSVGGQPHLLFFEGRKGKRVWMAAFRPHEIDSFVVK
ncbi:MAG: hypothetical protein UT17_C0001G0138 [Candidatus Woesebacteria bacterium GW2011_GWB1_39_10]|uniref:Uncharacterized protein n=3 Tax=Candidatus Woeseibacteriota TaxID=1752722 RepID=A0A0G0UU88_9BACT|nr:MAG: hypothetical protein UT17_C0001G0138 [Candidatus Woesebacteria bacterium GW2011_GWB1_39_10]KKR92324.1 MAG: hypothetical protein UU42_C0002G0138 [Candidatus Woesebacteria bacterium GW2011_GWA1_41_13b]